MKKIILGTLVLLSIGMNFGIAETKTKQGRGYYNGYEQATEDYSKGKDYNPNYCNAQPYTDSRYNCTQGYQDSWKRNSEVAPRTPKENSNKE